MTTQAGEVRIINQIAVSGAVWMRRRSGDQRDGDLEQNGPKPEITDETELWLP